MCLTIDAKIHKPQTKDTHHDKYTSRIAQRDILVYKVLEPCKNKTNFALSPYQAFIWKFGKLVNRRAVKSCYDTYKWAQPTIRIGLHACTTRHSAFRHMQFARKVFPAIVPKGSRVFFGLHNEIVSNNLIVYKNMEDLEAVHGKVAQGVKKKLIAI